MPPWHKDEGGPLDTEQIMMLREFILDGTHWGSYFDEEPLLVGDKRWKLTDNFLADHNLVPPAPLSQEDRGKALFSTANCIACHNVTSETKVGPGLAGIFQKDKLPNGKPVNDDTIKEWVQKGSASYKSDPSQQPYMPPYAGVVNTDDKMADMIAYLKTLKK
ncbi:MAG: cytochrome c [Chloroflexi bacterium]|nr:cytochrome c [Chloroflexota bacterium]